MSDLTLNTIARRMAIRKGDNCRYFSRHVCSFRDPRRLQREVGPWSNVRCAREAPIICAVFAAAGH